jgi:hypothetical protein
MQYPIPKEGKQEVQLVIQRLVKNGLRETWMSLYNTLVLPIKKTDETYRVIQDLRVIN